MTTKQNKSSINKIINGLKKIAKSDAYYTVIIPWAESDKRTKWHPTEKKGPFSKLSRGAFKSEEEAHAWAKKHLEGNPYEVKKMASTKIAKKEHKPQFERGDKFIDDLNREGEIWTVGDYDEHLGDRRYHVMLLDGTRKKWWMNGKNLKKANNINKSANNFGTNVKDISDKYREAFIESYKHYKGQQRGKHKVGDHASYQGKNWYLFDAQAESNAPNGILWILISPNARQLAEYIPDNEVTWEPLAGKKKASTKKAAGEKQTYVTSFCNFPHDVKTGKPINHECYILPPAALKAEMAGDYETAQNILHKKRGKMRMVNPRKTKDASIKTAGEQIYHVALDNIEWDTDNDEVNLPSHLTGKTRASSEEEAIERIIERASDNYDYLIVDAEAKAIIYKPKE